MSSITPDQSPARAPNRRAPSSEVAAAAPIAASAPGRRAVTSVTRPAGHENTAMAQGNSGGLFAVRHPAKLGLEPRVAGDDVARDDRKDGLVGPDDLAVPEPRQHEERADEHDEQDHAQTQAGLRRRGDRS